VGSECKKNRKPLSFQGKNGKQVVLRWKIVKILANKKTGNF